MGIFDDGYEQALINAGKLPPARVPATFKDAFFSTYEVTRQEDLSISERQNYLDKVKVRNEAIEKLTGEPLSLDLSDPTLPGITTVERARLAAQKRIADLSALHPEVKTDEDIFKEIVEDSKRIREKHETVMSNTGFAGKVGSFTGAMAATLTDPLVMASIPFGASSSASILRTALTEAGINVVSEAMIQPFVYRYKHTLGSPYDLADAMQRIAAAGAGGAVIGGGVRAGAKGLERLTRRPRVEGVDDLLEAFERNIPGPTDAQRDAAFVLGDYADVLRESPFEVRPELDDVHLRATAKAVSDLDGNQPVDVSDIVGDIPPSPERVRIVREPPAPRVARESQSLGEYIRNSGGVSIEKAGELRGEYEALFESGGSKSGTVKRRAGKSPDELAQLAHEAGFIDEPDPYLLKEALERDLAGDKVYSLKADRFERKIELEVDREYQAWARMMEEEYNAVADEIAAKAKEILDVEDVPIAHGQNIRSAREVLQELDGDARAAGILQKCLAGGGA